MALGCLVISLRPCGACCGWASFPGFGAPPSDPPTPQPRTLAGTCTAGGSLPRHSGRVPFGGNHRLLQAAAVLIMFASPAIAQSTTTPSTQNSGAGIPGQPGSTNGPAAGARGREYDQSIQQRGCRIPARYQACPAARAAPLSRRRRPRLRSPSSLSDLTPRGHPY